MFSSEGYGRKRVFAGETEEYHDALRFHLGISRGLWLHENTRWIFGIGTESCRNRLGWCSLLFFPFPCVHSVPLHRFYHACRNVLEQISWAGLSTFDPEALPQFGSRGFLSSLPASTFCPQSLTLSGIHPDIPWLSCETWYVTKKEGVRRAVSWLGWSVADLYLGSLVSTPDQSVWDLRWTTWHLDRFYTQYFGFPCQCLSTRATYSSVAHAV